MALESIDMGEDVAPVEDILQGQDTTNRSLAPIDGEKIKLSWKTDTSFAKQREIFKMLRLYVVTPGFKKEIRKKPLFERLWLRFMLFLFEILSIFYTSTVLTIGPFIGIFYPWVTMFLTGKTPGESPGEN